MYPRSLGYRCRCDFSRTGDGAAVRDCCATEVEPTDPARIWECAAEAAPTVAPDVVWIDGCP